MTLTAPDKDAGTKAALATILPSPAFNVETVGCAPSPHRVRKPKAAGGTTVAFSEYAPAVAGMPQVEAVTEKMCDAEEASCGPPKCPSAPRVSTMRQGMVGKKFIPPASAGAK